MIIDTHIYNVTFSTILSAIANIAMLFSVKKSKRLTFAYKAQLNVSASICLFYTAVNVFVNPSIAVLSSERTVLFVKGGFDTDIETGKRLLDIFVILIMITALYPTIQFTYRYLHIVQAKNKYKWERSCTWIFVLIPLFLSLSSAIFFCIVLEPSEVQILRYTQIAFNVNVIGNTSFLVVSSWVITSPTASTDTFEHDFIEFSAMLYMAMNMFIANLVIIFTVGSIVRFLKQNQISVATMKMHQQLNRTLFIQAMIPFITIHLPYYVSCLCPIFGWHIFYFNEYLPYLFSYYSVLMPFSVLYYSKDIRRWIFCCKQKKISTVTRTSSNDRPHWAEHRK